MSMPSRFLSVALIAATSIIILCFHADKCSFAVAAAQQKLESGKQPMHNPADLKVELRTLGHQTSFHLYETIPLEISYSSSQPKSYEIELNETMNPGGQTDWLDAQPPDGVIRTGKMWSTITFACCANYRAVLSSKPLVIHLELTDLIRIGKPGEYSLYLTTRRVSQLRPRAPESNYRPSDFVAISNLLTLTILPDDPEWDAKRLDEILTQLHDARVIAAHKSKEKQIIGNGASAYTDFARAKSLSQDEYVRAQKALNALDTPDAIRERVKRIVPQSISDFRIDTRLGLHDIRSEPRLMSSTRPDLVAAALAARAEEPDFPVDYSYATQWVRFLVQRDHPEIFNMIAWGADQQSDWRAFNSYAALEAGAEIARELKNGLAAKSRIAKEVTADTVRALEGDTARWKAPSGTTTK
jgi:hypothetical protein